MLLLPAPCCDLASRPAGVRARQERVPFVCCEDEGLLRAEAEPLVGGRVRLSAGSEGATLERGEPGEGKATCLRRGRLLSLFSSPNLPGCWALSLASARPCLLPGPA